MKSGLSDSAIVISSEGMGQGEESLRHRLLVSYLRTLLEMQAHPLSILLYADGVKMAVQTSPCRAELDGLAEAGSRIIICRTCLDHYGLLDQVPADEIGNMLLIIEAQAAAQRTITL